VYFWRSNVVFAILFCFVQNKFVFCKAIVGFYFGIVTDDVLAVIVFRKTICFWLCRNIRESWSCRLSFLYSELRRFSNNTLQRLWLNLVKLQLFINQKCSTVKGDSADWAFAMPRNQSVFRVGLPLQDWKSSSNCVDLKETLVSLKQFKVSDEMSRNLFEIPTKCDMLTFVVWIWLTVYASVPLHAVYASVPLREQTCVMT